MVQRDLGGNWNLQVGYVGNHMVRAAEFINMNAGPPGGGNNGTPLVVADIGNHSAFTINGPFSGGNYNALQTQLKRRVAQGQVGVIYTYSKTIDNDDTEANTGRQLGLTIRSSPATGRSPGSTKSTISKSTPCILRRSAKASTG